MRLFTRLKKRFKSPTPAKWRKIGNALLGVIGGASIPADLLFGKQIALTVFLIGIAARCMVEFAEENNAN